MSASHNNGGTAVKPIVPGRFTRATIHSPAGELEARLSEGGNWELRIKKSGDQAWRQVCDGDMRSGAAVASPLASEEPIRLGALTVDRATHSASVDRAEVPLSRKEFALLLTLATQPNRVFTKSELLRTVWGYPEAARTRTLDSHASRLRRKLHSAGAPGVIVNKHGVGYRFWDAAALLAVPSPGERGLKRALSPPVAGPTPPQLRTP